MSLSLARIRLMQFRSHVRIEADFDGRPVVLCGPNGAGKTNLLEAISLLSPGRGLRRAPPEELIGQPAGLGWRIEAVLIAPGPPHDILTEARPESPRSVRIDGKATPQSALGRLVPMLWLTPAMDRLWIEGAEGRRRFLDRLTLGFAPDHAEAALAYDKAMRERNRLLREGAQDAGWFTVLESRMAETGAQITANRLAALARLARAAAPASPFRRACRRAQPDRPAPRRSGRLVVRARPARRHVLDRRTKGASDRNDPHPCPGAAHGHRPCADPSARRGRRPSRPFPTRGAS